MSSPVVELRLRGFRQPTILERLQSIISGGPPHPTPQRTEPKASTNHNRQWCSFHGKVCCMRHGKHQRGKTLKGPRRN